MKPEITERRHAYWRKNLQVLATLLSVWFIVSFGCGILLADYLDQFRIKGFKLGFWFGHQGSIVIFVILIVIYAKWMNAVDREFGVEEADTDKSKKEPSDTDAGPMHH